MNVRQNTQSATSIKAPDDPSNREDHDENMKRKKPPLTPIRKGTVEKGADVIDTVSPSRGEHTKKKQVGERTGDDVAPDLGTLSIDDSGVIELLSDDEPEESIELSSDDEPEGCPSRWKLWLQVMPKGPRVLQSSSHKFNAGAAPSTVRTCY